MARRYEVGDLDVEDIIPFTSDAHVDLGYDGAPTQYELENEIMRGLHTNEEGEVGCNHCGNIDLFIRENTTKGRRYKCMSCMYNSETKYETLKSRKDITLAKFGLSYECNICGEDIDSFNRDSVLRHFKKHQKENETYETEMRMNLLPDDARMNPDDPNRMWGPDIISPIYERKGYERPVEEVIQQLQRHIVGMSIRMYGPQNDSEARSMKQPIDWWKDVGFSEHQPEGTWGRVTGVSKQNPNRPDVVGIWITIESGGSKNHPIGSRVWFHVKDTYFPDSMHLGWTKGDYVGNPKREAYIIKHGLDWWKDKEPGTTYESEYRTPKDLRRYLDSVMAEEEEPDWADVDWDETFVPEEDYDVDWESEEESLAYLLAEINTVWNHQYTDITNWVEHDMAGDGLMAYWDRFPYPDGTEMSEDESKEAYFETMYNSFIERFESEVHLWDDGPRGLYIEALRLLYVPVGTEVNVESLGNWENRSADQYGVNSEKITSWLWTDDIYPAVIFGDKSIDHMEGVEGVDFDRIILSAWIPWDAVSWASTIAYNISGFWQENELAVMDDEVVYGLDITRNGQEESFHKKALNAESLSRPWQEAEGGLVNNFTFEGQESFIPVWNTVFFNDELSETLDIPIESIVEDNTVFIKVGNKDTLPHTEVIAVDTINQYVL